MFQSSITPPSLPFHQCVHGIFSLDKNSLSVSFFSSALMLTRANGLSFKRSTISRSCGIIALHGPHQVAQMSRTTTFP